MKLTLSVILIVSICFLTCNKDGKYKKSNTQKVSPETRETLKLLDEIKKRTKRDLEIMGIKNVLLDNNGKWIFGVVGAIYTFKKNGLLIEDYKGEKRNMHWKVENGKLYITQNNKIFLIKAKPTNNFSYTSDADDKNKYLRRIKYVLILDSANKADSNTDKYNPGIYYVLTKYFKKYNNY